MEMCKKVRILVFAEKKREVYGELISVLREEFTVEEWYVIPDQDNPPSVLARYVSVIKNLGKVLKSKPDKVLICGGSLISVWIIVSLIRLFRLNIEIILFRYDIEYFWPYPKRSAEKIIRIIALQLEKFCFLQSDKILHKGLEYELRFLPYYKKIRRKPHYLYREFFDKTLVQNEGKGKKLSIKDNGIHLVYAGGLYFDDLPSMESFWNFYRKITSQKMHLHIYSKQPDNIVRKLKEMEQNDAYFHYEGYREHKNLIAEMTKYDYGIHMFGNGTSKKNDISTIIAFSNKNYDYLLAGLPVIATKNLVAVSDFITRNKIGFCINYGQIIQLKSLMPKSPNRYSKNIKRFINNYGTAGLINFLNR